MQFLQRNRRRKKGGWFRDREREISAYGYPPQGNILHFDQRILPKSPNQGFDILNHRRIGAIAQRCAGTVAARGVVTNRERKRASDVNKTKKPRGRLSNRPGVEVCKGYQRGLLLFRRRRQTRPRKGTLLATSTTPAGAGAALIVLFRSALSESLALLTVRFR